MWGQPPPAVRRSEAPLLISNESASELGELCSPGQPRAAVPTKFPTKSFQCLKFPVRCAFRNSTFFGDFF